MLYLKLSLIFGLLFASLLNAEEKAAAPAATESGSMNKDQKEYFEKTSKLTSLNNRIENWNKQFIQLVASKNAAKTQDEKARLIKEMVETNKERNKDIDAYNKLKSDLAYRYPNQGEQLSRRYRTQNKKTVEELEGVAGLDELLTRTKKVIDKKFATFAEPEEKALTTKASVLPAPKEEEPKKLRLEK